MGSGDGYSKVKEESSVWMACFPGNLAASTQRSISSFFFRSHLCCFIVAMTLNGEQQCRVHLTVHDNLYGVVHVSVVLPHRAPIDFCHRAMPRFFASQTLAVLYEGAVP